jgi:integrase
MVLADGQNGDWTPHDLRRTGATMMQALGVSLDVIDRCQNHVLAGSRVRRHYLHHDYAEEKKCAWNLLGDRLSAVLSSTYEHTPAESMMSFPAYAAPEIRTPS